MSPQSDRMFAIHAPPSWKAGVVGLSLSVLGSSACAQFSASGSVNSSANVVRILSVASTSELSFGTFAAGSTSGAVVMSATGNRSATGGVTLVSAAGGSNGSVSLTALTPGQIGRVWTIFDRELGQAAPSDLAASAPDFGMPAESSTDSSSASLSRRQQRLSAALSGTGG